MLILNLGSGRNRLRLYKDPFPERTLHLDRDSALNPDIVWDLNAGLPWGGEIKENTVDEIHAYHIIEHIGKAGELGQWFKFWRDCWKALKPYGTMYIVAPFYLHEYAVGDPTHVRPICKQTFLFLNRRGYEVGEDGTNNAMSQLGIDFDLPAQKLELLTNPGETIPCVVYAELNARKTLDGKLIEIEKEASTI